MSDRQTVLLVCAPATAQYCSRGSCFNYRCSRCGQAVMMAATGRAFVESRQNPGLRVLTVEIICVPCLLQDTEPAKEIGLTARPEIIMQEILTAVPNKWRERN